MSREQLKKIKKITLDILSHPCYNIYTVGKETDIMEKIASMKLRTTKTNRLNQLDARAFKAELHARMMEVFEDMGILATEVENAIMLEIAHDELGAIPVEAKFVVKPIDYDILSAEAQFKEKQAAAAAKAEAKAKQAERQ